MTMSLAEVEKNLTALRLHGMGGTIETRSLEANQGEISFLEAFSHLLQDEIDYRHSRLIDRRFKGSGLDEKK